MFSFLNIFRITALLEGVSYMLLLFIATPIKHFLDNPKYVEWLGMPHGILFMLYLVFAFMLKKDMEWNAKTFRIILLASIIPLGTFYIEKKYLKPSVNG